MAKSITYKDAGVDKTAGYKAVELMRQHVKSTFNSNVLTDLGGFSGLFSLDSHKYKRPVLVSGTDGVGTKLMLAFMTDRHNTIGQDCVAMCVNDILCQGAQPLFFLDYIASGKIEAAKIAAIVEGVATGCRLSGAALIGGETAEMPGLYRDGEYDLAGFAVGIVDGEKIITGAEIRHGDVLIGLPSSGLHSNGFSLVRKLLFEIHKHSANDYIEKLGATIGEELLKPTRIYAKPLLNLMQKFEIKGLSHITGGGFYENIPRMLPDGCMADIDTEAITKLPVFSWIQQLGNIETREMYSTFNMGVGMVVAVAPENATGVLNFLHENQEAAFVFGKIKQSKNNTKIVLKGIDY